MKRVSRRAAVAGYVGVVLLMSAGAATGLSGSSTVFSDDIVDGQVAYADIRDNAMTGKKILDNSITGADIRDSAVDRADLAFRPVSGIETVSEDKTIPANQQAGSVFVKCPADKPVVLGGGFETTSNTFLVKGSVPYFDSGKGWLVYGRTAPTEGAYVLAWAQCAADGTLRPE
jgi:hypothetical protein